jgi:integrase
VLVLANSGIRTGEANKLSVTDVHSFVDDKQRHNYRLVVRGKTGERDAVVRSVAAKRLDKYLAVRRAANPGGLLFVMPDESPIVTLIDQQTSALREAGIDRSSFGEKYSVYSLRHFYAVNALRNGIGVVARNMGPSVQMIQEYYGRQATASVFATSAGGLNQIFGTFLFGRAFSFFDLDV